MDKDISYSLHEPQAARKFYITRKDQGVRQWRKQFLLSIIFFDLQSFVQICFVVWIYSAKHLNSEKSNFEL